jgi:hypothetical protein
VVVAVCVSLADAKPNSSFGQLETEIGGLQPGDTGEYELQGGFSMDGYDSSEGIEVPDGTKVVISGGNNVMDAQLQGRFFAVHGSLKIDNVVMKNAQGINTGGAFFVNCGHIDITNITFMGCVPGDDAEGGAFALSGTGASADVTDCKFIPGPTPPGALQGADSILGYNVTFHTKRCPATVSLTNITMGQGEATNFPPTTEVVHCAPQCSSLKDITISTPSIKEYKGVSNFAACCSLCSQTSACIAFSITADTCALKSDTRVSAAPGSVVGLLKS